ncbi:hypothetical protein ACTFIZ_006895 [Dictyostelium cf. discoideum]
MKVLLLLVCLVFAFVNANYDACHNVICPSNYQCRGEGDQAYCVPESHEYGCDRHSCGHGYECVERWDSFCCKPIHHRPPHPHPRPPHPHPRPTNCDYTSCPREFSCHVINRNITACLPDNKVCRDFQCPVGTHCFNGENGPHCVSDMHYPNLCHVTQCSYDYTCKMVRGNPTCLKNQNVIPTNSPTVTPTTTPTTTPIHCTTCTELSPVCHSAGLVCRTMLNPSCAAALRGIINTRACCTYLALCVSNSTTGASTTTTTTSTTAAATTAAATTAAATTAATTGAATTAAATTAAATTAAATTAPATTTTTTSTTAAATTAPATTTTTTSTTGASTVAGATTANSVGGMTTTA